MNRTIVKEYIRNHVPDLPLFQRLLAYARLKELSVYDEIEKKVLNNKDNDSADFRREIAEECTDRWPKQAEQIKRQAQRLLLSAADFKGRESDSEAIIDILFSYFGLGFSPDEYIYYRLENRSIDERLKFLGDRLRIKYHSIYDNLIESSVFTDKYRTYCRFKADFKREIVEINTNRDYPKFEDFTRRHSQYVKKDVYASCGRAVELVDNNVCGKTAKQQFDEMISKSKYVAEELIVQSKELSCFNSSSVNTVRCITMCTNDDICIPFGFFRMGVSGSFVDNAGSGGLCCAIDMKTGQLVTDAFDEKGFHYSAHPNSGVLFKNHQLPNWDQLLLTAYRVASAVPGVKTIGWDFAHTENGWVIVEGNAMSQIGVLQIPSQRGMREDFERYFQKMKPIVKYTLIT